MCQISQNQKTQTNTGHFCIKKDHDLWDQLIWAAETSKLGYRSPVTDIQIYIYTDIAIINLLSPKTEEADGTVEIKGSQEEVGP